MILHIVIGIFFALLPTLVQAAVHREVLTIEAGKTTIAGAERTALMVNGSLPGPTLRWKEGDTVQITVRNHYSKPTSLHWHGVLVPAAMDGVPDLNGFRGIAPHESFTYHFTLRQSGTFWYHAHSGGQEQQGVYGAIIITPKIPDAVEKANHDEVVLLSDFTDTHPETILRRLKNESGFYNYGKRTILDFIRESRDNGLVATWNDRKDWGHMRMDPTDLADVTGYTFLINGKSTADNWTAKINKGETIRLRLINGSAMSFFDVRLPNTQMTVVQADGRPVAPVTVDALRMGVAETYDVLVHKTTDTPISLIAEPLDRSGMVRGTLAPSAGMMGKLPAPLPRTLLTMADMGMGGETMDHRMMHHDMNMPMKNSSGWATMGLPEGMKILSYADLKSRTPQHDTRKAGRTITVRLGGNMERYLWTLNGETINTAKPIVLQKGERVKLTFINETMMAHPMHLHGMYVQLVNGKPSSRMPDKHVVIVPPGESYSAMLSANEPGEWSFHCHLLMHMMAGMMTKVVVATLPQDMPTTDDSKESPADAAPHHHHTM